MSSPGFFLRFSTKVADTSGRPVSFIAALSLILLWAVSGPFFQFNASWQMVVNTGTTIITFLMVFLLQNAQNRDNRALQAKLDELILNSSSDNRFVGVENLDADELRKVSVQLVQKAGTSFDESPYDDENTQVEVKVNDAVVAKVEIDDDTPVRAAKHGTA